MAKLTGTARDDELSGSSLNDLFTASAGNDLFQGFDGIDRVEYKDSISKYTIKYLNGAVYIVKQDDSIDELRGIEQIQFGSQVFKLTEDHLTEAIGDTRPIDLMFSSSKETYFLSTTLVTSESINLDILHADGITKSRLAMPQTFSVSTAKIFESDNADLFVITSGAGKLSITKINSDKSATLLATLNLDNSSTVDNLSILSINSEELTLALSLWTGSNHISRVYEIDSYQQEPQISYLSQIDVGFGHGAFQLSNSTQAHIYVGLGPVKTEPVWGGNYYDTEVRVKILNADGTELYTKTLGGDEHITETYRTSLVTHDGKIVAGWIGLSYVLDENGGISGGSNSVRVRQEGYFYGAIFDPAEPDSLVKFLVNQNPEDNAIWSTSCELTGGELVFVWASNADGSGAGVYARIFDTDGNAITDQFQVNSRTWDNQTSPLVVADKSGGFTVFWNDSYYGGAFQRFDSQGNPNLISITGTSEADVIFADDGDQQILGGDGNDQISAGIGDDILLGGNGDDILKPGVGNDIISGGIGINLVDYNNLISGIELNLDLGTTTFDNFEQNLSGIQNVVATQFDDTLIGSAEANKLEGGAGNDVLYGGDGNDNVIGGLGDDLIVGGDGAGNDIYNGGAGTDTVRYSSAEAGITVNLSAMKDQAKSTSADAGIGIDQLSLVENVIGGSYSDQLTGNSVANVLFGAEGNDAIDGSRGADVLWGGAGDDVYYVDNLNDRTLEAVSDTDVPLDIQRYFEVWLQSNPTWLEDNDFGGIQLQVITSSEIFTDLEFSNPGKASGFDYWYENISESIDDGGEDLVYSSVTWSLGKNLESLVLTGNRAINGTGNNENNALTGNNAANTLDGMDGTDTLNGGAGNDVYVVDSTADTITEVVTGGIDTVRSSVNFSLASISNVENLVYKGSSDWTGAGNKLNNTIAGGIGNDSIIGDAGNDTLIGNAGNDTLDGGIGADRMTGGTGDDVYVVDNAKDTVTEKLNEGTDTIETTLTSLNIAKLSAIENLTYTGLNNATLVGNASVNTLTGNSGADRLDGGRGGDSLIGGDGNDLYVVDDLNDTIIEAPNEGTDSVQSSVTFTLLDNVENLTLTGIAAINGTGNNQNNALTGNNAANTLGGGQGDDTIDGGAGNDTLFGGDGDDVLIGGLGNDLLTGGSGTDKFRFDKALGKTNIDTIADFATGIDRIELDDAIFKKFIGDSDLSDNFVSGSTGVKALDSNDHLIFNTDTGALFYDPDGSGRGAMLQFATLTGVSNVAYTDFWIV